MRRPVLIGACALGWCLAVGAGVWRRAHYETTPGAAQSAPAAWPGDAGIERLSDRPLVVMALHPRCPCSRASVAELKEVVTGPGVRAVFVALVAAPEGADAAWTQGETALAARAIPGVRVVIDSDGRLAGRLGMRSSGHVVVYDRSGRLAFSGGITGMRGQTGPNPGVDALRALACESCARGKAGSTTTPVFGCALVVAREAGRESEGAP